MKGVVQEFRKQLTPPRWDSWQTMLLMSIFSALLAGVADPPVETIIASCGWIWLILGVWWFVYEYKKALTYGDWFAGPWLVSALIAGFFISMFPMIPISAVLILWAPIAAAIAILPNFIQSHKESKEPEWAKPGKGKRHGMMLLVLSHLVIACWFQFYFLLQNWLVSYPSLQAERFDRSYFVVNLRPDKYSRGRDVLRVTEEALKAKLTPLDWPEVEKWLLELNRSMPALQEDVQQRLGKQRIQFAEDNWWGITGQVTGGEYDLELRATWKGPSAEGAGHYITKLCRITPKTIAVAPKQVNLNTAKGIVKSLPKFRTISQIQCDATSDPAHPKPEDAPTGI
jgi:hypothetical protein